MALRVSLRRSIAAIAGLILIACTSAACSPGEANSDELTLQLGWVIGAGDLGHVVAMKEGYYKEEGITLKIEPGGPNIDGLAIVASGQAEIGRASSSPSVMLAASQGMPISVFAVGIQSQAYAYVSRPDNQVNTPQDLEGKTVGTQATGKVLLDALLSANDVDPKKVKVEIVGTEITPLATGQVDVWTGWISNLEQFPEAKNYHAMMLKDWGVDLYASPYYAKTDFLEEHPDKIDKFLRATAKGYAYAQQHPKEAVEMLLEVAPDLDAKTVLSENRILDPYYYNEATKHNGWGTMDRQRWEDQINLWQQLGQFKEQAPSLDGLVTWKPLERTAKDRPKVAPASTK